MILDLHTVLISANNPNESLGDFLTPTEEAAVSGLLPNTGSATAEMAGKFENLTTETETKPKAPATRKTRQTRTSQRQLDRELKEEAERIRKENQLLLKKEKEAMKKQSLGQSKIESDAECVNFDGIHQIEHIDTFGFAGELHVLDCKSARCLTTSP